MSRPWRERLSDMVRGLVAGLLFAAALWAWHAVRPSLPAVLGQPAGPIAGLPMETKPCTTVQALAPPAKKKLGLPASIQRDEQASALTAVKVPRTDEPLIATALLHRDTGIGEIYFTPQPRPWLDLYRPRPWTFDLGYGLKRRAIEDDPTTGTGYGGVTYLPVAVKRVALGGALHVYTDGDLYAGFNLRF